MPSFDGSPRRARKQKFTQPITCDGWAGNLRDTSVRLLVFWGVLANANQNKNNNIKGSKSGSKNQTTKLATIHILLEGRE